MFNFLSAACGVAIDTSGVLCIADFGNNRIRKIDTSGNIATVAGTGTAGYSGDGGPAIDARLEGPYDLAVTEDGTICFGDASHVVRKLHRP
jgi:DNA-binding beta-propeller fold protein YncE